VAVTSRFLRLAGQAYYRCVDAPATTRERKQAYLENAFFDAHRDDPEVGYQLLAGLPELMGTRGGVLLRCRW
jgi:putative transposase